MKRPKIHRVYRDSDLPKEWHEKVLILWEEDDARPPGRELADGAFLRMFGRDPSRMRPIARFDGGDWCCAVYQSGLIQGSSCEGGFVGVLLE